MTEKMDPTEQLANTMEMVAQLADTFVAAAASYREQCIAAGFNETAAEQMAVSMHQSLLVHAFLREGRS